MTRRQGVALRAAVAEIDLHAFSHNLEVVKGMVGPGVRVLVVVKADAYGHGAVPLAGQALRQGVAMLGVGGVEEGIVLRQAGLQIPILVLGGILPEQAEEVAVYRLTQVVYSLALAKALDQAGKRVEGGVRVHIKVDTGMGRLGVLPEEVVPFVKALHAMDNLRPEGIFTHLATAEEADQTFLQSQMRCFKRVVGELAQLGLCPPCVHSANSAGLLSYPQSHFTMVRPGIMLYGCAPGPAGLVGLSGKVGQPGRELRPVMTVKTHLVHLRGLLRGSSVGYGRTFVTKRDSLIATLPIGYADGFSRLLSNRAEVLVKGQRVPVVGRVSMDMCTVDVTGLHGLEVGDEVVVLGQQGGERILAEELAAHMGTIAYEPLCLLGSCLPRRYVGGGELGEEH